MKILYVTNRADWRKWLEKNFNKEKEVWLIYYKKNTNKPSILYDDSAEEALCFGWIDSIIKRIDEDKYARKFTPRTNTSKWSEENKERVKKLIKAGRMTKMGLAKIEESSLNKKQESPLQKLKRDFIIPEYLKQALMKNKKAWDNFNNLAPSYKRMYVGWVDSAKKEEIRIKSVSKKQ